MWKPKWMKEWWNNFLFLRFLGIGGIATVVHYGSYVVLLQLLKLTPVVSNVIAFLISFVLNFVLTHLITFRVSFNWKRTLSFLLTHSSGFLMNQLLFYFLTYTDIPDLLIPLFVFPLVTIFNFLMIRYLFKRS